MKTLVKTKILDPRLGEEFPLPEYATHGSAAVDLRAMCEDMVIIPPMQQCTFPTGMAIQIQVPGVAGYVLPRSGLGAKHGLILGNGTGLIDPDYQGEIKVCIWNRSPTAQAINPGDRIAQMVFMPFYTAMFQVVDEFDSTTERGVGGFGHTGR